MDPLNNYLSQIQRSLENALQVFRRNEFYRKSLIDTSSPNDAPSIAKEELIRLIDSLPIKSRAVYFITSGSTGSQILIPYSDRILRAASERSARALKMAGLSSEDTILNAYGHGLFPPGMFYDMAIMRIKANLMPFGSGRNSPTRLKLSLAKNKKISAICCVPSYALRIANVSSEDEDCSVINNIKSLLLGGEPLSDSNRKRLMDKFVNSQVFDQYGMAEAPMLAAECKFQKLHFFYDAYIPEVFSGISSSFSYFGQGELILTSRTNSSLPLFRYKTGDNVVLSFCECECGIAGPVLSNIQRMDSYRKIKGVLCSIPSMIGRITSLEDVHSCILEVKSSPNGQDFLCVYIAINFSTNHDYLKQVVQNEIYQNFVIKPDEIKVVDESIIDELALLSGKLPSFIDSR